MQLTLPTLSEPLRLWERIEIIVGEDDQKGLYLARIEDFIDDGIVISNPQFRSGGTLLRDGCEVVVLVVKEDAVYQFYSLLFKRDNEGSPIFILTMPRDIQRIQRRQFVRIDMVDKVEIANLGAQKILPPQTWHKTVSINVSGGGMLIKSLEDLAPPDILLVKTELFLTLNIEQPVAAICRRSFYKDQDHYSGIEFIRGDDMEHHFYTEEMNSLPETVFRFDHIAQNHLVTYVFQRQIELRKKGLI